jgi:hypothetical protein
MVELTIVKMIECPLDNKELTDLKNCYCCEYNTDVKQNSVICDYVDATEILEIKKNIWVKVEQ